MCQLEDRRRCLSQQELQVDQLSESTLIISQSVSLSVSGSVNQLMVLCPVFRGGAAPQGGATAETGGGAASEGVAWPNEGGASCERG